jgi:hypothetical protein
MISLFNAAIYKRVHCLPAAMPESLQNLLFSEHGALTEEAAVFSLLESFFLRFRSNLVVAALKRLMRARSLIDCAEYFAIMQAIKPSKRQWAEAFESFVLTVNGKLIYVDLSANTLSASLPLKDPLYVPVVESERNLGALNQLTIELMETDADQEAQDMWNVDGPLLNQADHLDTEQVAPVSNELVPASTGGSSRKSSYSTTPFSSRGLRRGFHSDKDGYIEQSLPYQPTRKKPSSVPLAPTPEVMQIQAMQKIGVEQCEVDPEDLTEAILCRPRV